MSNNSLKLFLIFIYFCSASHASLVDSVLLEGKYQHLKNKNAGYVTVKSEILDNEFIVSEKWLLEKLSTKNKVVKKLEEGQTFMFEVKGKEYRAQRELCINNKELIKANLVKHCIPSM